MSIEIFIKRKGFNINSKSLFLLELQDVKRITLYNLTLAHRPALSLFFARQKAHLNPSLSRNV